MNKLRVLDLFSGIGGFSLGLERTGGFETVAFCEIEEFPRQILAKHWPDVPCHKDVRELKGEDVGPVDVICGGYPCQPFSTAGKRLGSEDDRHLWPEYRRLVEELRPTWVIGENVAGHVSMGLDNVLSDLEALGYSTRTFIIPACAVGAYHRRDRTWIVANSSVMQRNGGEYHTGTGERYKPELGSGNGSENVAYTKRLRQSGSWEHVNAINPKAGSYRKTIETLNGGFRCEWELEPELGRVAPRLPDGMDRLKALGNAVVPQIPEMIGRAILEAA